MKSIQSKILILILVCVLIASGFNSIAGLYATSAVLEKESNEIMGLLCKENSEHLNDMLLSVENEVHKLVLYAKDELESTERLDTDKEYAGEYVEKIQKEAISSTMRADSVIAVYMRFDPKKVNQDVGFFLKRETADTSFYEHSLTDLTAYPKDDMGHVGWYYVPVENNQATWLMPYQNENVDVWMISYVVPLRVDGEIVGVIGMDLDFSMIEKFTSDVRLYDSGYAFVTTEDGTIMYHPIYDFMDSMADKDKSLLPILSMMQSRDSSGETLKYKIEKDSRVLWYQKLENDMFFCLSVTKDEIDKARDELVRNNILITIAIIIVAIVIAIVFSRHLLKPLKALNSATRKITQGQWNIKLQKTTNDEVGELTESFERAVQYLNDYMGTINFLAYVDAMTGVKNKTSYSEAQQRLEESICKGDANFGIAVFDVNNLKFANDSFGHAAGDALICSISRHICQVFKHSPVYRIGGDEFVAILEKSDLENHRVLIEEFKNGMSELTLKKYPEVPVFAACGVAVYDKASDKSFAEVFQRADHLMYQHKQSMKK